MEHGYYGLNGCTQIKNIKPKRKKQNFLIPSKLGKIKIFITATSLHLSQIFAYAKIRTTSSSRNCGIKIQNDRTPFSILNCNFDV